MKKSVGFIPALKGGAFSLYFRNLLPVDFNTASPQTSRLERFGRRVGWFVPIPGHLSLSRDGTRIGTSNWRSNERAVRAYRAVGPGPPAGPVFTATSIERYVSGRRKGKRGLTIDVQLIVFTYYSDRVYILELPGTNDGTRSTATGTTTVASRHQFDCDGRDEPVDPIAEFLLGCCPGRLETTCRLSLKPPEGEYSSHGIPHQPVETRHVAQRFPGRCHRLADCLTPSICGRFRCALRSDRGRDRQPPEVNADIYAYR